MQTKLTADTIADLLADLAKTWTIRISATQRGTFHLLLTDDFGNEHRFSGTTLAAAIRSAWAG